MHHCVVESWFWTPRTTEIGSKAVVIWIFIICDVNQTEAWFDQFCDKPVLFQHLSVWSPPCHGTVQLRMLGATRRALKVKTGNSNIRPTFLKKYVCLWHMWRRVQKSEREGWGALCVEMGFYADMSWESRCNIEINVWAHFYKILFVFEVPYWPQVKGMPGKS